MTKINTFITVFSLIIVLRFLSKLSLPIVRERKKGVKEIFRHMKSSFTTEELLYFKLALLWLLVFFYSVYSFILYDLYRYFSSLPLVV